MNLIRASQASKKHVEHFADTNDGIDKESLYQAGYVAVVDEKIEGCFILDPVEEGFYWLKQLYITRDRANQLPFLLEAILTLAKEQQAKGVYVHSHQPTVDIILEALQFHPQNENALVDKYPVNQGNWWSYRVSS
ncbi:GNAT family N-acetyltransferase [Virgibacillus alimentarius]|uniref:N-acetylglutamate synthase-like GNAT family acetyltransferase n=1 Tax=Virgibacillus alimentarius TaxID=698769 RepID=A0ABS4SCC0_9BACI|nr:MULTISPECIES: hypothetical protein [Virgibacillus]MBP2258977.1 N-acetylglutamate synthase-like GNAT family acetyltransferase [Virgibacillus alimentarius]HLR67251.1 hypothetical protein [Virgibacillus sp.]